jgi:hypothetical protein
MAPKKTSRNATHGAPLPNDDTNEDGAPISKADLANKKKKLISELVNERKKVETLNRDILKRIKEHVTSVTKYLSVIVSRDEIILTKEVGYRLHSSRPRSRCTRSDFPQKRKPQKKALLIEHDTAVALLKAQMDLKKKEVVQERSKACNSERNLTNATNKSSKLQANIAKCRKDYGDLACQVRDTKSELMRVKKELTSTKKKIIEQLQSTLAHKEQMKDKELEKE